MNLYSAPDNYSIHEHRTYFNLLAPKWNSIVHSEPQLSSLMQDFGVKIGDFVLDVGAGTGRLAKHLCQLTGNSGRVVAEDISEDMLKIAGTVINSSNCILTCADACYLPFKNQIFDKIVCYSVFPHILNPRVALEEFYRVLKPGGNLLVLHTSCSRKINNIHSNLQGIVSHDRLPRSVELQELLEKSAFTTVKVQENPELYWVEAIRQ